MVAIDIPMVVATIACLFGPAFVAVLAGGGKWGFIGGLTVGAVAGYAVMPTLVPIWVFFAIVCLDVVVVLGEVKV